MIKKIEKKLSLNKTTITNLSEKDMQNIQGATIAGRCTISCTVLGGICCDSFKDDGCTIPLEMYNG